MRSFAPPSIMPFALALAVAALWTAPAPAQQAVSDARLDAARGGFDLGNGLLASFGISRVIYVNGNLVAQTSVRIPDAGHITSAQAGALATASAARLIQNGPGNQIDPAALSRVGGTVIQNSLDNQRIKSVTTIDTTVNSLDTFRGLNLQDSLQSALIGSRGQ